MVLKEQYRRVTKDYKALSNCAMFCDFSIENNLLILRTSIPGIKRIVDSYKKQLPFLQKVEVEYVSD